MKTLIIDGGMEEYQLVEGGAPLRFNPKDPNVYGRFLENSDKIKSVEKEMLKKLNSVDSTSKDAGKKNLKILRETDIRMKRLLDQIFGEDNDFDKILRGVNLMAVGSNGKRVIENMLEVLIPIMQAGANSVVSDEVSAAKANREERRAHQ